jgi:hypothetical protein
MGCYRPWGADDAAMDWQAIDERGYWDGLTNETVVTRAAGVICPMARLLLADGTDASPDTGEWAAVVCTITGSPGELRWLAGRAGRSTVSQLQTSTFDVPQTTTGQSVGRSPAALHKSEPLQTRFEVPVPGAR